MKLLSLFVEFATKGLENVTNATQQIHGKFETLAKSANAVGAAITTAMSRANIALGGFVSAGIASSAIGEQLALRMGMLSREMAAIFLPTINKVIAGLDRAIAAFRSLSGEQQNAIQQWALAAATGLAVARAVSMIIPGLGPFISMMLGAGSASIVANEGFGRFVKVLTDLANAIYPVVSALSKILLPVAEAVVRVLLLLSSVITEQTVKWAAAATAAYLVFTNFSFIVGIIPRLIAGIQMVVAAITAMNVRLAIMQALSGPKGWATLAAGIAAAAAAIGVLSVLGNQESPDLKGGDGKGHRSLAPRGAGFESLQASWERIAASTASLGVSVEEKQLVVLEQIRDGVGGVDKSIGRMPPAFAK